MKNSIKPQHQKPAPHRQAQRRLATQFPHHGLGFALGVAAGDEHPARAEKREIVLGEASHGKGQRQLAPGRVPGHGQEHLVALVGADGPDKGQPQGRAAVPGEKRRERRRGEGRFGMGRDWIAPSWSWQSLTGCDCGRTGGALTWQ